MLMVAIYMAKPNFPEKQTAPPPASWGTWEELLLACAVSRYGAHSWDSVSAELRKRTSAPHHLLLLTPQTCKQKFLDLRRRFARDDDAVSTENDDDDRGGGGAVASIPFLDELRRLRVAELRREVERYDLSIVSLETKVEKLKEEREQSLRESGDERAERPDLEKGRSPESKDEEEIVRPENDSPEAVAGKEASGEGSVHDERSFDESNSTDLKKTGVAAAAAEVEKESDRSEPVSGEEDPAPAPPAVVEDSYDGSSDTIAAKGSAAVSTAEETAEKGGRVGGGGGESAESKGGPVEEEEEEEAKEVCSSEMQSSTSLSRKKVEEPDEPDSEDRKRAHSGHVASQSLVGFLQILRSHKSGSFFERRRVIQETPGYINMIRQHLDFETIRIRLEEGWYSGCKIKFFRDLMLVLNNAIVFFGKKAPESAAAIELRSLVLKEMMAQGIAATIKQDPVPKEETPVLDSKSEQQPSDTFMRKPKISVPMNACRKRSSIAARAASTSSSGPERKKEQTSALLDAKPAMSWKQSDKSSDKAAEEFPAAKKGRKERFRASTRSNNSNKSSASRSNAENSKNSGTNANTGPSTRGGGGTRNENSAFKSDKKENNNNNNNNNNSGKKQSATNFLNRMKRGSPLVENSKYSDNNKGGTAEQRKNSGGGSGRGSSSKQKEQATPPRRASGGKQAKEQDSPAKRSVGRPSKRAATTALASAPPAKRSRQSGETEVVASSRNAKKRSRK